MARAHLWLLLFALAPGCTDEGGPDLALSGSAGGTGVPTGETATSGSMPEATATSNVTADGDGSASDGSSDGSTGPGEADGTDTAGDGTSGETNDDGTTSGADGDTDAGTEGASESTGEAFDGVIDIGITAHNDCTFTVEPASISVPIGTEFTVNWVSTGASEIEFDVAKIDPFNQVPIILGLEPGTSYHDEVRVWCGDLFTGTFDFRLDSCFDPLYIPVDCDG